jgi:hypothetical protein
MQHYITSLLHFFTTFCTLQAVIAELDFGSPTHFKFPAHITTQRFTAK